MIPCSGEEYYYKIDNLLLSACQQIRALVRNRWRKDIGKDWVDGEEQGTEFIRICDQIYKKSMKIQKGMIAKGCLEDWDLSLLSNVLQNFRNADENKNENEAVRALIQVRNDLAHHPNKKLTTEDYNSKLAILRSTFLTIGLTESDIEKAIEKAGITSSLQALERVKKLYEKAAILEKEGNFTAAVECYTEAISSPSLLPVNQGVAYENRANCYLLMLKQKSDTNSFNEEHGNSLRDQAKLDAEQALELNDNSWKAHYLFAQCHRLENNFVDAIRHCQRALAISPVQTQIKRDLDVCKVLSSSQERHDHLNPKSMPMNLAERLAHLKHETGFNLTKEQFFKINNVIGEVFKGQDHVFRGHQYANGWEVVQDHDEAARHYANSAQVGNAEGIYNLGICYLHGRGVVHDPSKAFEYFTKAAKMSAETPGQMTSVKKNCGVASAQHTLGLMYDYGIHVEEDHAKAATWYSKACDNGIGNAANNLAWLHYTGNGVRKSEKMAEMYWNQGVIFKDVNAVLALMNHWIRHMEVEKALILYETGKKLGHSGLVNMKKEHIEFLIGPARRQREEAEMNLLEFEKEHKLKVKGLTFLERIKRKMGLENVVTKEFFKFFKNLESGESWGGKIHSSKLTDPEVIKSIAEKAALGSVTAERLLDHLSCGLEAAKIFVTEEYSTDESQLKLIDLLYECAKSDNPISVAGKEKITKFIAGLFDKCDSKGDFDMKTRFCFVTFNLAGSMESADNFGVELLKEGIRRYPNNPFYYERLADLFGNKKDHKSAIHYDNEGLKLFPDNAGLLYNKAICLHLSCGLDERNKCISAYEEFLKKAPSDHRKLPEAYYTLASEYFMKINEGKESVPEMKEKIQHYYHEGLNAEKDQLPCYLPYQSSERKTMLTILLQKRNQLLDPTGTTNMEDHEQGSATILDRKPYLSNPMRKLLHLEHRKKLLQKFNFKMEDPFSTTLAPTLTQMCAKKISNLQPITLKDMNPTADHIYHDCVLELTIIEDACLGFASVHLLAEDENGDVTRLYLYNVEQNKGSQFLFGFGSRIAILNPYMRIDGNNIANGIRNDEPKCIVLLEKSISMCRFCGEEEACHKCSKCERTYCSRECQTLDWKHYKHKLICQLNVDLLKDWPLSNNPVYILKSKENNAESI